MTLLEPSIMPEATTQTERLKTLRAVLEETNEVLSADEPAGAKVWPSGFAHLDSMLTGGFRAGELVLLGGGPGLGKTTFALQVARNLVVSGHSVVFFSFEHDYHSLLERLIVMEAAEIAGPAAVQLPTVRQAFRTSRGPDRMMMEGRLYGTEGGVEAVEALEGYGDRLYLHRSSGAQTDVEVMRSTIEAIRERTGRTPFVVVDYLQKVKAAAPPGDRRRSVQLSEEDRITVWSLRGSRTCHWTWPSLFSPLSRSTRAAWPPPRGRESGTCADPQPSHMRPTSCSSSITSSMWLPGIT